MSLLFPKKEKRKEKKINIWLCRNNPIVKIKLFVLVVLNNKLLAPREKTTHRSFRKQEVEITHGPFL